MSELIRLFTPPEWRSWHVLAKLTYVVLYAVGMAALYGLGHLAVLLVRYVFD